MTALVSFERVFEVLDLKPLVADRPGARELPPGPLGVELDDVTFRYPGADEVSLASLEQVAVPDRAAGSEVLHGVSLRVEPGQLLALVGPSGAGKTTITALVARLYDVSGGAVRVGGVDVRDLTQESLHSRVGVVTQEAHLFHDTVRSNLAYAKPDATEAEMVRALRDAQIWDLVAGLPEGLDTVVGDRGHRLSGGEKQRIALARLLLKAPGVVVLDEATAHLDSESELAVQKSPGRRPRGPDRHRDRPPAVDRASGRRHRRRRGRARRGAGPARRAAGARWAVRRPVPHPVRRHVRADQRPRRGPDPAPVA